MWLPSSVAATAGGGYLVGVVVAVVPALSLLVPRVVLLFDAPPSAAPVVGAVEEVELALLRVLEGAPAPAPPVAPDELLS